MTQHENGSRRPHDDVTPKTTTNISAANDTTPRWPRQRRTLTRDDFARARAESEYSEQCRRESRQAKHRAQLDRAERHVRGIEFDRLAERLDLAHARLDRYAHLCAELVERVERLERRRAG